MRWICGCALSGVLVLSLPLASQRMGLNDGDAHGDAPYLIEDGWAPLLNGRDLTGWHTMDGKPMGWISTRAVIWDRLLGPTRLGARPGEGGTILNSLQGRTSNL